MAKSKTTVCLFQQLLTKSPEERKSAQVALLVVKAESNFKIAIAETEKTISEVESAYENERQSPYVNPKTLVALRNDLEGYKRGLELLEQEYNELFVNPVETAE